MWDAFFPVGVKGQNPYRTWPQEPLEFSKRQRCPGPAVNRGSLESRGPACPVKFIVHSIKGPNGQQRGAKCVPWDLTLTEWTGLSVTEGVSEWFGRQYPFPSISRHLGHDSIQLCTDTAQPRSAPGGRGLTSETSRQRGWSMPSDNKWNNHLFSHPSTSLHLPSPSLSDQLENDKDKWFYLNIGSDTEKRQEEWGEPPSLSGVLDSRLLLLM